MVLKKLKLGVMQGRLLPKYKGKYQAHPVDYWEDEFVLAKALGLNSIEFILDFEDYEKNPLIYSGGIQKISTLVKQTGVEVLSICADFFMLSPFTNENINLMKMNNEILVHLINISSELGVKNIVIPCVDSSSLKNEYEQNIFIDRVSPLAQIAFEKKVNLALETDLSPKQFKDFLDKFNLPAIKVNYDIGNSASLGFNCFEEFQMYGDKVTDIHIKDRVLSGGSVALGTGYANFSLFFETLLKYKYEGVFIMQAFRDDEGLNIFKKQLEYIMPLLEKYEGRNDSYE